MTFDSFAGAFFLVAVGGFLTGAFAVPMQLVKRWSWENTWLGYSFFAMLLIPTAVISFVVPGFWRIYTEVPLQTSLLVFVCGCLWGIGAVTFGLGIKRLGMGLGFSLIMGISTLLGTLLPFFLAEEVELKLLPFGLGMTLLLAGVAVCGVAGNRRELATGRGPEQTDSRYATGIVICVVSGIFSSLFNVGMVIGRPVQDLAAQTGAPQWASGNTVWPALLCGGFLANAAYCGHLMRRNHTAGLYASGGWREWGGAFVMGSFWIFGVMLYGAGAYFMGDLGPILGWPVYTSIMLISAYLLGRLTGEWRGVAAPIVRWMNSGIGVIVVSLFLIGYSR